MKFKVKVDSPLVLTMVLIAVVLLIPVIIYFPSAVSFLFIAAEIAVLYGFASAHYRITDKYLVLRFGLFAWRFRLSDVKALERLKAPYRFKMVYGKGSYTILSVCDPEAFAAALRARIGVTPPASRSETAS